MKQQQRWYGVSAFLPLRMLLLLISLVTLPLAGCGILRSATINMPMLNDGFEYDGFFFQDRRFDESVLATLPSYGEVTITLPKGLQPTCPRPVDCWPAHVEYERNRNGGPSGAQARRAYMAGRLSADGRTLRLRIPYIQNYHPRSLYFSALPDEVALASSSAIANRKNELRIFLFFSETKIDDPYDYDRYGSYWRSPGGRCLDRGAALIFGYVNRMDDYLEPDSLAQRNRMLFETRLQDLCVFRDPTDRGVIATDSPGYPLRSNVRLYIPSVFLHGVEQSSDK